MHALSKTCSKSLSPTSRRNVASNIHGDPLVYFNNKISKNVIKYRTVHDDLFSEALRKKQEAVENKAGKQIDKSGGNL